MAAQAEITNMALFCDFENVALGVADAKYAKFDIDKVLDRLLLKGSIVVKKAYCDWDRYKGFKGAMHEASFELIEIPHVRMSGKNSADIRMVVDALDLCYTKSHVDTFVIISGDSDFSPLVSKLREEDKKQEALELILQTIEALGSERGDDEKIWGSMVKQALKRRKPGFNEAYYGYRSFNKLLEEAAAKHLVNLERDEKSGGYIIRMLAHED